MYGIALVIWWPLHVLFAKFYPYVLASANIAATR